MPERRGLLEQYIGDSDSQNPGILRRFDSYLSTVRTGSEHTRRAYNNNVYEYLRYIIFQRCELPKDYIEIAIEASKLHYLDLNDNESVEDKSRTLIPYNPTTKISEKITGRQISLARKLLGKDFNFSVRGDRFVMQLRSSGNEKNGEKEKSVEIRHEDQLMINYLCSVYDPESHVGNNDVCMDKEFWSNLFRRDRLGEFERYVRGNGNTERTVLRKLAALSQFVRFLVLNENLLSQEQDPFYRMKRPVIENTPQLFLDEGQIEKIYSNIERKCYGKGNESYQGKRDRALFSVSTGTLIRASANCNLRIEDIDFDNHTIKVVEKGKKIRVFHLTKRPWKDLVSWLNVREKYIDEHKIDDKKSDGFVYVTERGNPMHYRCWHRILSEYADSAGVRANGGVSPHDLRRSIAKQMHRKGADIFQLQKILGHRNIQTTAIYLDIMGIDEEEVIEKFNPFA